MAETQFTYVQTTSLVDRRYPRRVKLSDVNIETTEDMRGHKFECLNNSEDISQSCAMPEMESIEDGTDLQRFVIRIINELNFKGKYYHPNRRSAIQKDCWHKFNRGKLRNSRGEIITNRTEVTQLIQAKQFLSTLPKLALEMVQIHLVMIKAGIQIQWFFPGQNNLVRIMKTFLGFNQKITRDMFEVDPILREPFIIDDIVRYHTAAQLIPTDKPLVMIAPLFISTPNATTLLERVMDILPNDETNKFKGIRYNAYVRTCYVDAPFVHVTAVTGHKYRPIREYRMQTHAHRLFLTLIGKMDMPMISHHACPDYDQCLHWNNWLQPGERAQIHQVLNHRPKLRHILQINRLQTDDQGPIRYEKSQFIG